MAGYGKKSKSGGFTGNLSKLGGSHSKLALKSDYKDSNAPVASMKKGRKQSHKKV
jgi:hypothetical protein